MKKAQIQIQEQQPVFSKLVRIKDIVVDEKLYPRVHINFQTQSRYYNAIRAGANLPPVTVATKKGDTSRKYTLVDGRHRIEAMKDIGEEFIQAEVFENLTSKEIFIKAVEMNTIHGKPFDANEVVTIAKKLQEEFEMKLEEISAIVRIPIGDIEPFIAKRITRVIGTGESFTLKKPLYDYAGVDVSQEEKAHIENGQKNLDGIAQIRMIEGVITLVRGGFISKVDESVEFNLKKLYKLLKARYESEEDNINKLQEPKKKHKEHKHKHKK